MIKAHLAGPGRSWGRELLSASTKLGPGGDHETIPSNPRGRSWAALRGSARPLALPDASGTPCWNHKPPRFRLAKGHTALNASQAPQRPSARRRWSTPGRSSAGSECLKLSTRDPRLRGLLEALKAPCDSLGLAGATRPRAAGICFPHMGGAPKKHGPWLALTEWIPRM